MLKGYFSSRKPNDTEVAFPTVEPIRKEQHGLSVLAHQFTRSVGNDAAEAGSTESVIEATAHAALKGDVINVTSGAFSGYESKVWAVTPNNIYLADAITLGTGDTFEILRHKYPAVDDSGNLLTTATQGPTQFVLDGVNTEVERDTVTPGNSIPFPVIELAGDGNPVDHATEATQADVLSELQNLNSFDFATQAKQDDIITALGNIYGLDFATETTLASVLTALNGLNAVDYATETSLAALLSAFNVEDFATEASLSGFRTDFNAVDFSTEAKQDDIITELQTLNAVDFATEAKQDTIIGHVDGIETLLASIDGKDFATETTLAAMSAKLPATLGQKTKANSLAVVLASDSDALPASQSGNWSVRAQDGAGNALTSEAIGSDRPLHTHAKGGDIADSARKATGTVTSAAWVELIASTAAECQGLCVFDSSGYSLELGVGGSGSEVRKLIIPPGGLNGFIPLRIPAGSRVSIRALGTNADYTTAEHLLTLLQ